MGNEQRGNILRSGIKIEGDILTDPGMKNDHQIVLTKIDCRVQGGHINGFCKKLA